MEHTVCFTGHRFEKMNISEQELYALLEKAVEQAVSEGYTEFISGMAMGCDITAAEVVLERKKTNPNIRLICAVPYDGFEQMRTEKEKEIYRRILSSADEVHYICNHYSRMCFQIRNVWMVDRSSKIIAAYTGEKGGTRNTIRYAEKCKKEICNVLDEG